MMDITPGPYTLPDSTGSDAVIIADANGEQFVWVDSTTTANATQNGRHVIACLNGCHAAGLTAEMLEAGAIKNVIAALVAIIKTHDSYYGSDGGDWDDPIRDALTAARVVLEEEAGVLP